MALSLKAPVRLAADAAAAAPKALSQEVVRLKVGTGLGLVGGAPRAAARAFRSARPAAAANAPPARRPPPPTGPAAPTKTNPPRNAPAPPPRPRRGNPALRNHAPNPGLAGGPKGGRAPGPLLPLLLLRPRHRVCVHQAEGPPPENPLRPLQAAAGGCACCFSCCFGRGLLLLRLRARTHPSCLR